MWSQGAYAPLAERLQPAADRLAASCELMPGADVLDVAAGNGNFASIACRAGCHVSATDLTPAMLELGKARFRAEGLDAGWHEAEAAELPFPDGSFDVVASVFGAIFSPDPAAVVSELRRVCRPGGTIALATYRRSGFVGAFGMLIEQLGQPSPFPSPFDWGELDLVTERLEPAVEELRLVEHRFVWTFFDLDEAWSFWERTNGPLNAMRQLLAVDAYADLVARGRALMADLADTGGGCALPWDWLEVIGRRST